MTLRDLELGSSAEILSVGGYGSLRQHFLDMGIIPGAEVTLIKYAPMGDPMELQIHGYELTLRLADAEKIEIRPIDAPKGASENTASEQPIKKKRLHPGLGEGGKYHIKVEENPLPQGTTLTFAL
ncbi:MAG: ferrous iron transport protein A, partial [Firmicutes bacterium]|nr:ferrous iron transport protein A [Bacillota bacterium]